jgi:DNA-binding response OmpR family regulator
MTSKVLLIEDEPTLVDTITYNLKREGYDVLSERDGERGLQAALQASPDLVILDLMLPKLDGLEVCRQLRRTSNVPVIMLTARNEEMDKVLGLEMGADDYVGKPFSMRELMARVKAMLRRQAATQESRTPALLQAGDFVLDESRHEIRQRGQPLALTPLEYDLLAFLLRNRGTSFSRESLLEIVWCYDFAGDTRTVDVHVRSLRAKIEDTPSAPVQLVTVRGVGYRLDID